MPSVPTVHTKTFKGHKGPVNVLKYNTEGNYCLSGGQDKTLRLWNAASGVCIKVYEGHGRDVSGLSVTKDNARFASCGGDKSVFLWDVLQGRVVRKFSGHMQRLNDVAFNDDAVVIASASYDATVRVWDSRQQGSQAIQVLDEAKDSVSSVVIRGHEIFTGSVDDRVRTYDIRMGEVKTDFVGEAVTSLSLSKDGNCLLISTLDDTIRLLDKENGTLLNEFKGHKNHNYKVQSCFNDSDSYVISGSEDHEVYIWDLLEGAIVRKLDGHKHVVISTAHHPKSTEMLTGAADGEIRLWTAPEK